MILAHQIPEQTVNKIKQAGYDVQTGHLDFENTPKLVISSDEEVLRAAREKGIPTLAVIESSDLEKIRQFGQISRVTSPQEVVKVLSQMVEPDVKKSHQEDTYSKNLPNKIYDIRVPDTPEWAVPKTVNYGLNFGVAGKREIIAVTGSKGGTGKTTVAACLGIVYARERLKVVVVDFDLRAPSLGMVLQTESTKGLPDFLATPDVNLGEGTVYNMLAPHHSSDVQLLLSPAGMKEKVNEDDVEKVIRNLSRYFDVVILDLGCLSDIPLPVMTCFGWATRVLVVTQMSASSLKLAQNWFREHRVRDLTKFGIVANRVNKASAFPPSAACRVLGLELLAALPDNPAVLKGEAKGNPLPSRGPFLKELEKLADIIWPNFKIKRKFRFRKENENIELRGGLVDMNSASKEPWIMKLLGRNR